MDGRRMKRKIRVIWMREGWNGDKGMDEGRMRRGIRGTNRG